MLTEVKSGATSKLDVEQWYIGPSEAAKRSDLAQTTIHYALHSGQLRGFRVGRRWLIAVEDLHAWIRGDDRAA